MTKLKSALHVAGRVSAYLVTWFVLLLLVSAVVNRLPLEGVLKGFHFGLSSLLAALVANWFCLRFFEGATLLDIGLRWSGRNLAIGLAAGVSSALLVTVVPVAAGMAEWHAAATPSAGVGTALLMVVLYFAAASNEEVSVRGYLLQRLLPSTGLVVAAALTGALFASGHLNNPNASKLGMLNTFIAGVTLACAYRASGELWFPIGIHFGWNTWLTLCGADVSGFATRMTNYELVWKVGPLWSGGGYGPEGGLLTTIAFSLWLLWAWKAPLLRRTPWWFSAPRPGATPNTSASEPTAP